MIVQKLKPNEYSEDRKKAMLETQGDERFAEMERQKTNSKCLFEYM